MATQETGNDMVGMADMEKVIPVQIEPERTMQKKFTFWTALGIALCCSGAVSTIPFGYGTGADEEQWEGWIASMAQGIVAGGSVGLFWGWIFVSIGIAFMACSLAELVR